MRLLSLYLRSRKVLVTTLVAVACAGGIGIPEHTSTVLGQFMALLAITAVVSVAAIGLGAPDPALDRTAALPWGPWRAAHVLAVGALAAGLGTVLVPSDVVVRNAIGLTGLAALAVTTLGGGLAWSLPLTWMVVTAVPALTGETPGAPAFTWPFQPAGTTAATLAAGVLGGSGVVAYALAGPRATR
jgi:hypothetical protein